MSKDVKKLTKAICETINQVLDGPTGDFAPSSYNIVPTWFDLDETDDSVIIASVPKGHYDTKTPKYRIKIERI